MENIGGIFTLLLIIAFVLAVIASISYGIYTFLRFIRISRLLARIIAICSFPVVFYLLLTHLPMGCGSRGPQTKPPFNGENNTSEKPRHKPGGGIKIPPPFEHFDLERLADQIKSKMANNVPDTMEVGTPATVTVRITRSLDESVLLSGIPKSKRTFFKQDTIEISSRVKVSLLDPSGGENFRITRLNSEEQVFTDNGFREWKWSITPLQEGSRNELDLLVSARVSDRFGSGVQDIPVFEKPIFVKTTAIKKVFKAIEDNWQWLSGAIFFPLFYWGRGRFIKWRSDKKIKVGGFGKKS